jgi:hypothetical protein
VYPSLLTIYLNPINMKNKFLLLIAVVIVSFSFPNANFAQAPTLGTVKNFVFFTTTGAVSNTGVSVVLGKLGTNNGAITGFTYVPGQEENANAVTAQAMADLSVAYDELFNADPTFAPHAPVLGNGETLVAGVYIIQGAGSIEGILNLDAGGNAAAIFIFQIQGAFSPGPSSQINLVNGALACNVFWAVEGGAVAMAALSDMKGTFIAHPGAVSMADGSKLEGRLLSTTGAVAVDGVTVSLPFCNLLPVELVSFAGTCNNQGIKLAWSTATENNSDHFTVERSMEEINWQPIATIKAAGNATTLQAYNYSDGQPHAALVYYRLKQTDINGNYKYGNTIAIKNCSTGGNEKLAIYPNPSHGKFDLLFTGNAGDVRSIQIFDAQGKKMVETNGFVSTFDFSGKTAGPCYMKVNLVSGSLNLKFIIQ